MSLPELIDNGGKIIIIQGDLNMQNSGNRIVQSVSGSNNMVSNNMAGRDVVSTMSLGTNSDEIATLEGLLEELKQCIIKAEVGDSGETVDDIEIIKDELKNEEPKKSRIQNAWKRIQKFVLHIPEAVAGAKLVIENGQKILAELKPMIDGIVG